MQVLDGSNRGVTSALCEWPYRMANRDSRASNIAQLILVWLAHPLFPLFRRRAPSTPKVVPNELKVIPNECAFWVGTLYHSPPSTSTSLSVPCAPTPPPYPPHRPHECATLDPLGVIRGARRVGNSVLILNR